MRQMISILSLEEWLEYIALLAAVSGLLLIVSAHLAIAIRRSKRRPAPPEAADGENSRLDNEMLLRWAMKERGKFHLAVAGVVFTLAKIIDLWLYPGGSL